MSTHAKVPPRLEIHIPAFNEEKRLPAMLACLERQTFREFNLVIHDNGSTDATLEIARRAAATDGRIRINQVPINSGAFAQGMRFRFGCNADYVGVRSANDLIADRYVEDTVRLLDEDSEIALAYSYGHLINSDGQTVGTPRDEDRIDTRGLMTPIERGLHVMQRYGYAFPLWGVYRRKILEQTRPPRFSYGNDHVEICEMALYGHIASTADRLDFRHITANEVNFFPDGVQSWARHYSEELVRGVPERNPFGPFAIFLPFTNLIWGHIEMFSVARIDNESKLALSREAVNIFCARFGGYLKWEVDAFFEMVNRDLPVFISELRAMPTEVRALRLGKLRTELNKLRVIPFVPLASVQEIEIFLARSA